ncbi:hypothetical protein R1sor_011053 [Riccia sorocarpa]|uniref:SH3 domain-containing protein n=1 Tax=Riccia sorocarpa TaxID=122646 RepID=A0ABD3HZT0_9MARC
MATLGGSQGGSGGGGRESVSLMDLISADPVAPSSDGSSKRPPGVSNIQLPTETSSPARVLSPPTVKTGLGQRRKKPLTYSQLARLLSDLAGSPDLKNAQKQLLVQVFPKLAVYSSVDPSLVPPLLQLHELADDRHVVRYVYYYLARVLAESGAHGGTPAGVVPTPNWDALATLNVAGSVTRADVVPQIVDRLIAEAANTDPAAHPRRVAALKALSFVPVTTEEMLGKLYMIVFKILDKVADAGKLRRKKGIFGRQTVDKESATRSSLQYAALSTLRRLPLDPDNPAFLHRAVQGIACADPVGVRHALAMVSELAPGDPFTVAMAVAKLSLAGGSLQEVLHIQDVLARVYLARLCYILSSAEALDEKPDLKSHFRTILYQLLLDPSERVCFEAIDCILGKVDGSEGTEIRARGWAHLITAILRFPEPAPVPNKDGTPKDGVAAPGKEGMPPKVPKDRQAPRPRRPQPLIKLVMRRLESALRHSSRPVLHGAVRVVQEMGKSRAAAYAVGGLGIDEDAHADDSTTGDGDVENEGSRSKVSPLPSSISTGGKESVSSMLSSLMEAVRITVACECVYVRAAVIKAMIWMLAPYESVDELKSIIAGELADPAWPASLLNDIVLTLHARFKATPEMAVILLDISRLFATKVPGKIDSDVLQLLWKTCLLGCGPEGKHTALEAVTVVLDLPPPPPASLSGFTRTSTTDPKSALALQRLIQAAVWFLGENANYAAAEYAWESNTPPGAGLLMLDSDKMVAAANSRNPTLAGALTRLQRCAFSGSWEVRLVAAQALMTLAIRSGEPYRVQIYDFMHALAKGGAQERISDLAASNGEDQGASGTGLSSVISPMLRVLDELYKSQDQLIKDMRSHDNRKEEWTDDELKKLFENHERLLDLVSLFCFVPRSKYLPLGPTSLYLLNIYRKRHRIDAHTGSNDPAVATGISDLLDPTLAAGGLSELQPLYAQPEAAAKPATPDEDEKEYNEYHDIVWNIPAQETVNEFLGGGGTEAPEADSSDEEVVAARPSVSYEEIFSKGLMESEEEDDRSSGGSSPESSGAFSGRNFGSNRYASMFAPSAAARTSWDKPAASFRETKTDSPTAETSGVQWSQEEEPSSVNEELTQNEDEDLPDSDTFSGNALYDFVAGGDDELNITAGEELEIEYEVGGWYFVKKKEAGPDGKLSGLVPVSYVSAF